MYLAVGIQFYGSLFKRGNTKKWLMFPWRILFLSRPKFGSY
jgi:hypothetical protein